MNDSMKLLLTTSFDIRSFLMHTISVNKSKCFVLFCPVAVLW
jgi:hypothetical protein